MLTILQANYDMLEKVSRVFENHAAAVEQTRNSVTFAAVKLRQSWDCEAAKAFLDELDTDLLPAVVRLRDALLEAADVTKRVSVIIRKAEIEAATLFEYGDRLENDLPSSHISPPNTVGIQEGTREDNCTHPPLPSHYPNLILVPASLPLSILFDQMTSFLKTCFMQGRLSLDQMAGKMLPLI